MKLPLIFLLYLRFLHPSPGSRVSFHFRLHSKSNMASRRHIRSPQALALPFFASYLTSPLLAIPTSFLALGRWADRQTSFTFNEQRLSDGAKEDERVEASNSKKNVKYPILRGVFWSTIFSSHISPIALARACIFT